MLILDITVVNVALPDMERTLHTQLTDLEWVVDAYAFALASLLLIAGSLADRIGRRRVYIMGMIVFTSGSLASSLASSPALLIAGRGVQGIGAACLFASSLALIGHAFRGAELGRALGVWGAAIGGGLAIGPLVGGLLTDAFGWPSIFLVNIPLGLALIGLAFWRLPESAAPHPKQLDWLGFVTFGSALFLLVFGLVEGNRLGWSSWQIVGALSGAALVGAFWVWSARRDDALFDVRILADRRFLAATIAVMGQGVVIAAVLLFLLRVLQEAGGASPLLAGAEVLPMTAMAFAAAILAGRLVARFHPAWLLGASLLLLGAGSALMLLYDPAHGWLALLPGLLVAGAGWGATNPVAAHASLQAVSSDATGMASGFNNTARQVGIAVGVGALGAIFVTRTATATASQLHGVPAAVARHAASVVARTGLSGTQSGVPASLQSQLANAGQHGMVSGVHLVELAGSMCAIGVAAAVFVIGLADVRAQARVRAAEEQPPTEETRRAA
jgi:EmrB/QacA subfamily drug resistance transporter